MRCWTARLKADPGGRFLEQSLTNLGDKFFILEFLGWGQCMKSVKQEWFPLVSLKSEDSSTAFGYPEVEKTHIHIRRMFYNWGERLLKYHSNRRFKGSDIKMF